MLFLGLIVNDLLVNIIPNVKKKFFSQILNILYIRIKKTKTPFLP